MDNIDPNDELEQDTDTEASDLWAEFAADDAAGVTAKADDGEVADDFGDEGSEHADDADDADAPADEPAAPSPWDSAPAELRTEYERVVAEKAAVEQKARSATGRATGFQRRYEDLLKAAQPRQTAGDDRADTDAALAAIKDDYPEIGQPLEKVLGRIEGNVKELSAAEERRREAAVAELDSFVEAETSQVLNEHPDYLEVLGQNGQTFLAWVEDQPKKVRDAFTRNSKDIVDAAETIEIVSSFKAFLGTPAPTPADPGRTTPSLSAKRERQLAATASPSSRQRRPTVSGIPENGDPQEIWKAMAAAGL